MRHFYLTTSIIAALMLSACAEAPQNERVDLSSADATAQSPTSETAPQDIQRIETRSGTRTTQINGSQDSAYSPKYENLDLTEISQEEIDELKAFDAELEKLYHAQQSALLAWSKADPTRRGPPPEQEFQSPSPEKQARILALQAKLQLASVARKYENYDPNILSKAEVSEIVALEKEQIKQGLEYQRKITAWSRQDPATRGPQPRADLPQSPTEGNSRFMELQSKVAAAREVKYVTDRMADLSATYNISLSDSEISELTQLEMEKRKFQIEVSKATVEAQKNAQHTGGEVSQNKVIEKMPKHLLQRMIDIEMRTRAIQAPLLAAEKADRIQTRMTQLSQDSGVPILSGEIAETIALNAEKDRIESDTEFNSIKKWLFEGGDIDAAEEALPNDEDYARIKEIDARIKEISGPMNEAKFAAQEANNPALKQQRLEQEKQQKWQSDWRDKQQAGKIPADVPLTSPSYAEIQDRVSDYRPKLQYRADEVGYSLSDADLNRLDALNAQMLAIRETVYDMEVDGTSRVKSPRGYKTQSFGFSAGMHKVRMIQAKQREILAGLTEAERSLNAANQNRISQTGTRQLYGSEIARLFPGPGASSESKAERMIERFRKSGLEISASEAEDLLAFERALQDR